VSRRAAAQRPPVGEASSPTSSVLLKYCKYFPVLLFHHLDLIAVFHSAVDPAKRLDTRRFSSPLENEEDNAKFKDDLDPEGFNRLASNSTPEPDEHPVQAPPAGTESLAQTAKMLQAFGKRYEDLAKHIKEIPNTAQALKRTAANLMQPMERYLNYYMQEQPLIAHDVVFPPNEPVFVISVDEEHHGISEEMDATDEDQEEDFARFKAEKMLRRGAQKGKEPDPKHYKYGSFFLSLSCF
jgi:hypothetical protein